MYDRLIQKALTTPWLVTAEMRDTIYGILRFRAAGGRLTADELRARIGSDERERPARQSSRSVAVIPIWGVIANRNFDASSGMTSIEAIRPAFRRALADEDIAGIVLDMNSPGGAAPGVPEFADEVFAAREVKPVIAYVDDLSASANYWIAAQAAEIFATPSSDVGCIGVYLLHISEKVWLEREGITVTDISYGVNKTATAPWKTLDPETQAFLQAQVDRIGRDFDAAVARGRGVSVSDVRDTFGQGRVYAAKDAKKLGMIDRIGSFEDAVARASRGGKTRRSMAASSQRSPMALDAARAAEMQRLDEGRAAETTTVEPMAAAMDDRMMVCHPGARFMVGDQVKVKPEALHDPSHEDVTMTIADIGGDRMTDAFYAVTLPDGTEHRWYRDSELEPVEDEDADDMPGDEDSDMTAAAAADRDAVALTRALAE